MVPPLKTPLHSPLRPRCFPSSFPGFLPPSHFPTVSPVFLSLGSPFGLPPYSPPLISSRFGRHKSDEVSGFYPDWTIYLHQIKIAFCFLINMLMYFKIL